MEYKVRIQPRAERDLSAIYDWLLVESLHSARPWLNQVTAAIASLENYPRRAPLAPENEWFEAEIRQLLFGKKQGQYRILFTIKQNEVHILHVRHARRAWWK